MTDVPASERVRIRRGAAKGRYDRDTIYAVIDSCLVAHLGLIDEGQPLCIPMLCSRVDDEILVHGSAASRSLRLLASGAPACLTVTSLRGLVLARSAFEHSANYESVSVLGRFRVVAPADRMRALEAFTEKLLPGRWEEIRGPSASELKATVVFAMAIDEAAAKVRSGPPDDDGTKDALLDTWAGVVPIVSRFATPEPSPRLRPGIPVSPSVRRALELRS